MHVCNPKNNYHRTKMAGKRTYTAIEAVVLSLLLFVPTVFSDDTVPIPAVKSQLNSWFQANVKPLESRKATLDPALVTAEAGAKVIKVRQHGGGDFKTVTDAIKSIPNGNTNRVIVWIGGGNYTEKIMIDRTKPFVTFYGDPNNMPTLIYAGTSAQYGTVDSATLIVESDYFTAVNIKIANSSPRPNGKKGEQALALRISGDKASFFNCKLYGFQDTLCDDNGLHFFKDCYIEGTVDFIFGNGKSIYLNTETHVIPGEDGMAMITAQARHNANEDTGYSFVHCTVTGTGGYAVLGRAWMPYAKVVFAYTQMSDAINPKGWSDNFHPGDDRTVYFGEYNCMGPGSNLTGRVGFAKKLRDADAKPFLSLAYIQGSKWLLPPPSL